MSIRNIITEKVILPISDLITQNQVNSSLKFLLESKDWPRDRIEEFQNKKLRQLIHHSYNNVQYYKELFDSLGLTPDDVKTIDDLEKLPILTKETIRENINNGKLIASNLKKSKLIKSSSSGSTGEPLQFFITPHSYSMNIAANLRGWYNMGYRLGDRYIKLSVNPRSSFIKKTQDLINNCYYFSSKGVDEKDIKNFYSLIKKSKPKVLRGYPSTLSVIADYLLNNNLIEKNLINSIQYVNTTGEILFKEMKDKIEKVFDCKVYDSYSGEGGATMFQDKNGIYNIAHEYAITEVYNNKGNKINYGVGEIITTDLWNYANPFIRYAVNDSIEVYDDKDSSKPMRAKRILGRNVDMLKTPSGKILIVHFFTGYFEWIPQVKQFQLRQDSPEEFVLSLVVNDLFTGKIKNEIFVNIQNYIGKDVILKMEVVDSIPSQINGKTRFMLKNF